MTILSGKSKKNESTNNETLLEAINLVKQLTKQLIGDSDDLDTVERGMTDVLQDIRKQATKELIEEKDRKKCTCSCGCKMKSREKKSRSIIGLVPYSIRRRVFVCPDCGQTRYPLDEIIGCLGRYTLEVKTAMTLFGQRLTFSESSHFMQKLLKVSVSHELIQEFVEKIGKAIADDEKYDTENLVNEDGSLRTPIQAEAKKNETAYMQMDGTMVHTREEGWKEVKNGMFFRHNDLAQTDKHHTRILGKEYYSVFNNGESSLEQFLKTTTQRAHDFCFHEYKNPVILADGATWIWNYATKHHPYAIQILDYYHAEEYLGNAFQELIFESKLGQKYKKDYLFDLLEEGKVREIIDYFKTQPQTEKVSRLITYFENNIGRMNYKEYRSKGFQIGSGSIESANKIITHVRMKQAGMRWGKSNVQSIVSLRCKYLSGQWDSVEEVYLKAA